MWMVDVSWAVLFSHPRDYTPVCTTELGRVVLLADEFRARGVKLIALSCDSIEQHKGWSKVSITVGSVLFHSSLSCCGASIGVNPAGDTGDVSPPENWTAGDGNALCPPQI